MPIKVEAAIVTQKKPLAEYNTDSVNVNGKVMPREVIQNGYKGSGVLSGKVYFTLASSDVEGFADASVVAFNERAELFARARDPISVFSGFFEDCRGALFSMNRSENELVSAGFYASGRKAVLAHNGDTKLYLQRLGIITPVTTDRVEDTTADFSAAVFNDVCEGDIFILLSPGASQVLGDKEIEDILRISDGSVKRAVNYMLKVGLAGDGDKAVSAIVIKVLETSLDEDIIPEFMPEETGRDIASASEDNDSDEAVQDAVDASVESVCEADSETLNEATDDAAAEITADVTDEAAEEDIAEENVAEAAEDDVAEIAEDENSEAVAEAEETTDTASDISEAFSKNALEMFEMPEIAENPDGETDSRTEDESSGIVFDKSVLFENDADKTENTTEKENNISEKTKKGSKKLKTFLLFGLGMLIAFAAAAIVVFFVKPSSADSPEEITVEEITTAATQETTVEETTDEEASEDTASEDETEEEVFIVG